MSYRRLEQTEVEVDHDRKDVDHSSIGSAPPLHLTGEGIDVPIFQTGVSDGKQSPFEQASVFGTVMFTWMTELVQLGSQKILEFQDVYLLPKVFSSPELFRQFYEEWEKEVTIKGPKDAKVSRVLWRCFKRDIILGSIFNLPYMFVVLLQPYFVLHLLFFIVDGHTEFFGIKNAMGLSVLLGVFSLLSSVTWSVAFHFQSMSGLKLRGAMLAAIYVKTMRLSAGKCFSD
jgi:hypothetical protein